MGEGVESACSFRLHFRIYGIPHGILEGARSVHPCAQIGTCRVGDRPDAPQYRSLGLQCTPSYYRYEQAGFHALATPHSLHPN